MRSTNVDCMKDCEGRSKRECVMVMKLGRRGEGWMRCEINKVKVCWWQAVRPWNNHDASHYNYIPTGIGLTGIGLASMADGNFIRI